MVATLWVHIRLFATSVSAVFLRDSRPINPHRRHGSLGSVLVSRNGRRKRLFPHDLSLI